jgi:hypothetical protein
MEKDFSKKDTLINRLSGTIADLPPSHVDIILDFFNYQIDALEVFIHKQYDYGPGNIAGFGEVGVLIRLNDKIERLKNLMLNNKEINNESVYDTWLDIANYGLIGLMCKENLWPNVNKFTISQ